MTLSSPIRFLFLIICCCFLSSVQAANQHSTSSSLTTTFTLSQDEQQWLRDHPEITVGVMDSWPPFDFIDKYGKPSGIGSDLIIALNKRLGGILKLRPGSWNDIYNGVKNKKLDALLDITNKQERKQYFHFTSPYLNIPHVIVAKKQSHFFRDENDLIGKTIGLERGFGNIAYFKEKYPGVSIKEYKNTSLALDAVSRGEVDAYAGNRSTALYLIGREVITNLKVHGRLHKPGSILSIGVRKDWPVLTQILDRALADLDEKEMGQILARWAGDPENFKQIVLANDELEWIKNNPEIRIAFDENYPPYSFKNKQGEFVGIAVDVARELARRLGLKLSIYPSGQWDKIYQEALNKNIDTIATMVKIPEREKWFEFTRPYISLSQYVITRKTLLSKFENKSSLSGNKIALIENYSTTKLLLEDIPNIDPLYVANIVDALEAVSTNKAQATVADIGISHYLISKHGLSNLGFSALYNKGSSKQRFGVIKNKPELASILDKALKSLSEQELMNFYSNWSVPESKLMLTELADNVINLTEEEKIWLRDHPVIRLASDYSWPPFETIDENGQYEGIAADYIKLIEQRLGIKFVISPRKQWSEITEMVKNKELDLYSCAMETEQRREYVKFTQPFISNPMVIVTRSDIGYIDGIKGLQGMSIAIEKGYASFDLLSKKHPELILKSYPDSLAAMFAVSSGEAEAYIGNISTLSEVVRKQGITNIKVSGQIPYRFDLALGARNDWPELIPILQKALDSITQEEKNTISAKWVSIESPESLNYVSFLKIIFIISLLVMVILYWNYILNKKVQEKTSLLTHQAHYDSLTDLPNRILALDRLEQLIGSSARTDNNVVVMFLDIDDFKKINDTLGHDAGD